MSNTSEGISAITKEAWNKTTCSECKCVIDRDDPRVVIMAIDLGYGPNHESHMLENWSEEEGYPTIPGNEENYGNLRLQ